ncbi:MAG: hypothetical protein RL616_1771 [Verrucomicrobiota bacterium]|jgi:competence protein ComGC
MSEQNKNSRIGLPILEIAIVVFIIGILVAIVIPNLQRTHLGGSNACINNLRQLDAAANQFALEHNLTNDARISFPNDLTAYIKLNSAGKIPPCPAGGSYYIGRVGKIPTCSLGSTVTPAHVLP